MDLFLKSDVLALLDAYQAPCVSIFLPTHRSGPAAEQNPLRAKRMLRWTEDLLESWGLAPESAKRLLRPLRRQFYSSHFWSEPGDALVAFCSADYCRTFHLPVKVAERLEVGERFHVEPLLSLADGTPEELGLLDAAGALALARGGFAPPVEDGCAMLSVR